jgi:nucleoside-diphosphate-sugar epimerase
MVRASLQHPRVWEGRLGRLSTPKGYSLQVWGTGEQGRDFVYIDDCCDAFFVILDKARLYGSTREY